MNRYSYILCILLSLSLFAGCARGERIPGVFPALSHPSSSSEAAEPTAGRLRVAASPEDTLNPYTFSTRINGCLIPLLYDPLVKLDQSYQPQNYLAESVVLSGTVCTVRLRGDVYFSSGSLLRAPDVVYSLELCRQNSRETRYRNLLSAEAADDRTVVFTLARPDAYFANLLTFPVIEEGSGGDAQPPGSGRYRPRGPQRLVRNDAHFDSGSPIREIELVPVEDMKELGYEVITGTLDYALLDPGSFPVETAGSVPVQTNSMLYLGCNTHLYPLSEPAFRQALGKLLDRRELVNGAYSGQAVSTPHPLNPLFYPADDPEPDPEAAGALLDELGFTGRDENGYRTLNGRTLELSLAIPVESADKRAAAKLIQLQLEKGGLKAVIGEYPYETYKSQIEAGACSLYLGYVRLAEDMDLSAFLESEGSLHYQLGNLNGLYESYLSARQEGGYEAFLAQFQSELPFMPLLFPQASAARSRNFYSAVLATEQDIFYNIHKW
ncbi:MAG: hypothetical protein HFG26_06130 [Provencibacterium sp.]|nr:hypothetical protein [Provencibacterium sp.]